MDWIPEFYSTTGEWWGEGAVDTWWQVSDPDYPISQTLRCYTLADLALLWRGTGFQLGQLAVRELSFAPSARSGLSELLRDHHQYLAILHRDPQ